MRSLISLALILLLNLSVFAAVPSEFDINKSFSIQSRNIEESRVRISLNIDSPEWRNYHDTQKFYALFPGTFLLSEDACPIVPVSGALIRLPNNGGGRIEINSADYDVITDVDYAFEAGEMSELDGFTGSWYPENIIEIDEPAIFHDFRVARVQTCPVQVNIHSGDVRVYKNIDYTIHFDANDSRNALNQQPTSISSTFLPFYRDFLNWSESDLDEFELYRGNVIVLVEDNAGVLNALQPWIEWKEQKGWKIELLTDSDVNWNNNAIRTELINRYESAEVKFDFVVVIGDANGAISCPPGSITHPDFYGAGDFGYAALAGNDILPDVAVGRISVESLLQLNIYVNKLLAYEKNPYMEEDDWFAEGLVAAGSILSGVSTVYTCEFTRERMLDIGYDEVHTAYFNDGLGEVNPRIVETINDGVSFHLYRGVMGSGLMVDDIMALQNSFKTPAVIDITCGRGDWGNTTSISEAYMRAGSTTVPRGGIGCISTATTSTNTRFNNALTGGAIEASFVHQMPSFGAMLVGANLNMWENLRDIDYGGVTSFSKWTNLIGDPTVWLWTDEPRPLNVTTDTEITIGSNAYEVMVTDHNGPVENAWVTLYRNDTTEEIISRAVTDIDGTVILESPFRFQGTAILTVTAQNAHPSQTEVNIINDSNSLGYADVTILDDGSQGTWGNGNGRADYGETVGLIFTFHNFGLDPEANIEYSIESMDQEVVSIQGSGTINNLPSGGNYVMNQPALVEISSSVRDHYLIEIDLHLQNMNGNYWDSYNLEAHAPVYEVNIGRYNAGLTPGIGAELSLEILNTGSAGASASNLSVSCTDSWLNIDTGSFDLDALEAGGSAVSSPFTVLIDGNAFPGYQFDAELEVEFENGRSQQIPFKIGLAEPQSSDPFGPDNYGYSVFENGDTAYNLSQPYSWIEINPEYEHCILPGIELDINDDGENQDTSVVFDLPFNFQYYGEIYDQITICSNGWIAMGDQSTFANQRNWTIPSPLGPDAMMAPYWDDRIFDDGGVYVYSSAEEGWVIIQWQSVPDISGNYPNSFQVILYKNFEDYPAPENENDFLFQYKNVHHSEGFFSDIPYWTTGIENHYQNDGLQVAYFNDYAPGIESIEDLTSLFFTCRREIEYGTVEGIVTNMETNLPMENVRVSSTYLGTTCYTNANGFYSIEVVPGNNSIVYSIPYFETVVIDDVEVEAGGTITRDTQLYPPSFFVSPSVVEVSLHFDEEVDFDLTLSNTGDLPVEYTAQLVAQNPAGGTMGSGEIFQTIDLDDYNINEMVMSMTYHDNELFVATMDGWWDDTPRLHVFDLEGNLLNDFTFDYYLLDMSWNSDTLVVFGYFQTRKYLYGNNALSAFYTSDDCLEEKACVVMDLENQFLYSGSEYTIERHPIDFGFGELMSMGRVTSIRLVHDDPGEKIVHYVFQELNPEYFIGMKRIRPSGDDEEVVCTLDYGQDAITRIAIFQQENHLTSTLATCSNEDNENEIHLRHYLPVDAVGTLSQNSGTVEVESEEILTLHFDGEEIPHGIFHNWLIIDHNSFGNRIVIPVTVESDETGISIVEETRPDHWGIDNVWPNPFNPSCTVKYSLKEGTNVKFSLFNVLGQEVIKLEENFQVAGTHSLKINGSHLSSGIYFLNMNTGRQNFVKKLMILK